MTEVKLCGLTRPEDVDLARHIDADFLGFIFFPGSKRHLDWEHAAALTKRAAGRGKRVAVTVDPDDAFLDELLERTSVDLIQLHGHESPARVAAVKERTGRPVVKAFSVAERADVARALPYAGVADRLLFDAKAPPNLPPGGNGLAFDWHLLEGLGQLAVPWGVAGGLTPENAAAACQLLAPDFIDVASGVEASTGGKDPAKVRALMEAVKATAKA